MKRSMIRIPNSDTLMFNSKYFDPEIFYDTFHKINNLISQKNTLSKADEKIGT